MLIGRFHPEVAYVEGKGCHVVTNLPLTIMGGSPRAPFMLKLWGCRLATDSLCCPVSVGIQVECAAHCLSSTHAHICTGGTCSSLFPPPTGDSGHVSALAACPQLPMLGLLGNAGLVPQSALPPSVRNAQSTLRCLSLGTWVGQACDWVEGGSTSTRTHLHEF